LIKCKQIPCRTAMRGSFPLNGTYFQVNEVNIVFFYYSRRTKFWPIRFISGTNVIMQVFADHCSSQNPIDVPRSWIWDLPRRTVYFGTSVPTIFRGIAPPDDNQEWGSCINIFPFPQNLFLNAGYGFCDIKPYNFFCLRVLNHTTSKWRTKYINQVSCS
jgi:hypothetical protein